MEEIARIINAASNQRTLIQSVTLGKPRLRFALTPTPHLNLCIWGLRLPEDVLELEVAVADASLVRVMDRRQDLPHDDCCLALGVISRVQVYPSSRSAPTGASRVGKRLQDDEEQEQRATSS